MRILIVDDTPGIRRLLRAALEGENFEVLEVADGMEALATLKEKTVDAIISDILMPNMDGYRFSQAVRGDERLCNLPLIIYSSTCDSAADEKLALYMGADKFIKKPAPIKDIVDALNEIISRGPRTQAPAVAPEGELSPVKLYNETLVNKLEERNEELVKQTEALQASEEKFRQLAENLNDVFWVTSADHSTMIYISPSYERVWGRTCQSLYDNPFSFSESVHPDDRQMVADGVRGFIRGENYDLEYRIVRPDKQIRWIHARGRPICDEAGNLHRMVGVAEDITPRKTTEAQLRQAQKMETIGQLAGGVAHDFNNLLMIIGANLEMLQMTETNLGSQSKEYINDIAHAADRAATLTRQLLAFSRSEAMQKVVLNLNDVITNFTKLLKRILGAEIRVVNDLDPRLPLVKADAGMVEQVLMNLAVNARDAMPKAGLLSIGAELVEIDNAYVEQNPRARAGTFACVTVEDTGTGIAPENLPRIFEPFYTTKGVGKGTGLGLATVFGIAEQHRGWVTVSSKVGVGTVFRVYFPVTSEPMASTKTPAGEGTKGRGERILVAEDDKAVRGVIAEILQRNGYMVFEADSGIAARQIFSQEAGKIDLLLTDMVMGVGINGLELAEMLRMEKPGLKVILTSGYSAHLMSSEVASQKGLIFLKKPFPQQALVETVRKTLRPA